MLEVIGIYPKPIHVPLSFWQSEDYKVAGDKMMEHFNGLVADDSRLRGLAVLESQCELGPLGPYLDYWGSLDDFCAKLADNDDDVAERFEVTDAGIARETKANQYITAVTELANEYVPKLSEWSRESVFELPADFTPIAMEELSCHVFINALDRTVWALVRAMSDPHSL